MTSMSYSEVPKGELLIVILVVRPLVPLTLSRDTPIWGIPGEGPVQHTHETWGQANESPIRTGPILDTPDPGVPPKWGPRSEQ